MRAAIGGIAASVTQKRSRQAERYVTKYFFDREMQMGTGLFPIRRATVKHIWALFAFHLSREKAQKSVPIALIII
jgi:hypothetical protein